MVKKLKEYKPGDFIFAKVKGYPAWPARVKGVNGKKYFVYFYGTGETANLAANVLFDYLENKEKFLVKPIKRKDFNDGVAQIEYDINNKVPVDSSDFVPAVETSTNDVSLNDTTDTTADATIDESVADTTAADDTTENVDESAVASQNETAVEDSDDGHLVIDETKQKTKPKKGRPLGSTKNAAAKAAATTPNVAAATTPKSTTPKAAKTEKPTPKEPSTPKPEKEPKEPKSGKKNKEVPAPPEEEKVEEIVSRSGRKIKPKRFTDAVLDDTELPITPPAKKRRAATPLPDKPKEKEEKNKEEPEKTYKLKFINQAAIENIKEPFGDEDSEEDKRDLLVARLPNGTFVGVKLFENRPVSFTNLEARVQWEHRSAKNAIRIKQELESGQTKPESISNQLEFDLNLSDEHKVNMEREREQEEKKWRVQFLQTEMALVKKDCEIKDCIKLNEADTEQCLKLLDELQEMEVQPLMFLKHPTVLESIKRLRSYVGNVPAWELSQEAASKFNKQAHLIRKIADTVYNKYKTMFETPDGLSFWEYFSARVMHFKKVTAAVDKDELVVMVQEPPEMKQMTAHSTRAAIDAANQENSLASSDEERDGLLKDKKSPVKASGDKSPLKRQSSKKSDEEKNGKESADEPRSKTRKESAKKTEKEAPKTPTKKKSSN